MFPYFLKINSHLNSNSSNIFDQANPNFCMLLCIQAVCYGVFFFFFTGEQGRAWTAGSKLHLLQCGRGGRGRGVNAVSVFSPNPPNTKNNATLQWATLACYIKAMAPQRAKGKNYIYIIKTNKKKKSIFTMRQNILMHFQICAFHMLFWASALSRTFSQQSRMQN